MLVVKEYELITWIPDFSSSGLAPQVWTKVMAHGQQLCNSLEWVFWENPVQTRLCEDCGMEGCSWRGYVHICRLGEYLLWLPPYGDELDPGEPKYCEPLQAIQNHGSLLTNKTQWDEWQYKLPSLPDFAEHAPATRSDLAVLWIQQLLPPAKTPTISDLVPMLKKYLLATSELEVGEAIGLVEQKVAWMTGRPDEPLEGKLVLLPDNQEELLAFYLDMAKNNEWNGFRKTSAEWVPAIGPRWVYKPGLNESF